jgi:hypothetical protein
MPTSWRAAQPEVGAVERARGLLEERDDRRERHEVARIVESGDRDSHAREQRLRIPAEGGHQIPKAMQACDTDHRHGRTPPLPTNVRKR